MSVLATYIPDEVYTTTRNQMLTPKRLIASIVQWWPDQSNLIVVHCFVLVSTDSCSSCMDLHLSILTVEPPIKDPPSKGQPPNNGHIAWHQTYGCSVI